MKQLVILIKDVNLVKPLLDLAKNLRLSVDNSNYDRSVDEVISIGTSKKYLVAGNNNFDFYQRKFPNIRAIKLERNSFNIAVDCLLNNSYTDSNTTVEEKVQETVVEKKESKKEAIDKKIKTVPTSIITSLYAKVKSNKKSPNNYYIKLKNNDYIASTIKEDSLGNLQELFNLI